MNILVTGSNGLLGQAITNLFARETDSSVFLTSAEDDCFVSTIYPYEKLDITNRENIKKIVSKFNPDTIINCAAFTEVDKCESERELCWKINVDAVKNLIIAARPHNIKLVHFSTDYIFDGKNGPYKEDDTPNPISFYGRSKLASENALVSGGVECAIIRTMVLYGIGVKIKQNFVLWLVNQLQEGKTVTIVDDQIGNCTMIDDLAYGTLKIIEKKKTGVYNIAGKEIISRYEFALKVCEIFGCDKKLVKTGKTKDLNQPASRPLNSGLINYKAETGLDYKPMDSLEGLQLLKIQMGY